MYLCIRVDLDYVPWQPQGSGELPHSESAMFIRLLEVVRKLGPRLHFFATSEVMRAFPTMIRLIMEEGHDLDCLCLNPLMGATVFQEASQVASRFDYTVRGLGLRDQWPSEAHVPLGINFISAKASATSPPTKFFPIGASIDADLVKSSGSIHVLDDDLRNLLRDYASRRVPTTFCVHLPALAMVDRQLLTFQRLIDFAESLDMPIRTLRQAEGEPGSYNHIIEN